MRYEFDYVGRELERMLNHGKPMSAFCRAAKEDIDEFSGQEFSNYVISGDLCRNRFYLDSQFGRLIYTVFTLPEEQWRFYIFKELKKTISSGWSAEKEFLESWLLGYQ